MTLDKFRKDFLEFLENSTVNLGRRTSKTRQEFMIKANGMFDKFVASSRPTIEPAEESKKAKKNKTATDDMNDRVMCIKPKDKRKALDGGKGVTTMTASESQRADEQLGRSPYAGNPDNGE